MSIVLVGFSLVLTQMAKRLSRTKAQPAAFVRSLAKGAALAPGHLGKLSEIFLNNTEEVGGFVGEY
jgi:hypothetical protein